MRAFRHVPPKSFVQYQNTSERPSLCCGHQRGIISQTLRFNLEILKCVPNRVPSQVWVQTRLSKQLAGIMEEVNLMQPGQGWLHAIASGEGRRRAGLQMQQRGLPNQIA